jgi:hypothetical protein
VVLWRNAVPTNAKESMYLDKAENLQLRFEFLGSQATNACTCLPKARCGDAQQEHWLNVCHAAITHTIDIKAQCSPNQRQRIDVSLKSWKSSAALSFGFTGPKCLHVLA